MFFSTDHILTSHAGVLPRPEGLKETLRRGLECADGAAATDASGQGCRATPDRHGL